MFSFFFFNDTATTEIYTLSLHDALPILLARKVAPQGEALKRLRLGTALLAVGVIVVNLFGRHIGGRIDLTPGNSFTLSDATRQVLGTLPDLVTVKLFEIGRASCRERV